MSARIESRVARSISAAVTSTPRVCACACNLPVMAAPARSEEHTSELQSQSNIVCRLLLEKKKKARTELVRVGAISMHGIDRNSTSLKNWRRVVCRSTFSEVFHMKKQELVALFFFNDTATTEIYTLSLHDALPICGAARAPPARPAAPRLPVRGTRAIDRQSTRLNSSHSQISYAVFCLKQKKHSERGYSVVKRKRSERGSDQSKDGH